MRQSVSRHLTSVDLHLFVQHTHSALALASHNLVIRGQTCRKSHLCRLVLYQQQQISASGRNKQTSCDVLAANPVIRVPFVYYDPVHCGYRESAGPILQARNGYRCILDDAFPVVQLSSSIEQHRCSCSPSRAGDRPRIQNARVGVVTWFDDKRTLSCPGREDDIDGSCGDPGFEEGATKEGGGRSGCAPKVVDSVAAYTAVVYIARMSRTLQYLTHKQEQGTNTDRLKHGQCRVESTWVIHPRRVLAYEGSHFHRGCSHPSGR